MKRMILTALLLAMSALTARAEVVGELKGLIVEAATSAELEETVFPAFYLITRADAPNDMRVSDGITPGGLRICPEGVLTNIPNSFPHPVAMNGNTIALNGSYSIGAEGPHCYIRSNGSNVLSILAQTAGIGKTIRTEYAGDDTLRVIVSVDDSAADPLVEYSTSITEPVWTDCVYAVTRPTTNLMQIDITMPDVVEGYFRITALTGFRVRFGIPLEAPEITTESLTLGGSTWTSLPESLPESDPVWLAERSNYATGTPLYAFTESDPAFTNWLDTNETLNARQITASGATMLSLGDLGGPVNEIELWANTRVKSQYSFNAITGRISQLTSDALTLGGDTRTNWPAESDPAFTNWLEAGTNELKVGSLDIGIASDNQSGKLKLICYDYWNLTSSLSIYFGRSRSLSFRVDTPTNTSYFRYLSTTAPTPETDYRTYTSGALSEITNSLSHGIKFAIVAYSNPSVDNYLRSTYTGKPIWINGSTLSTGEMVVAYNGIAGVTGHIVTPRVLDADQNGASGSSALAQATNCTYNGVSGSFGMFQASNCTYNGVSGYRAMYGASGCDFNGVSGFEALFYVKNCDYNGASGYCAMYQASNCTYNGVLGASAMRSADNCHNNGVVGDRAMYGAIGSYNGVLGYEAMCNASGFHNGVVGYQAMYSAAGISRCGALGNCAMQYATNCEDSVAAGYGAMTAATLATNALALGSWAGRNATGSNGGYIDCYTADPGDAHNPTNDLIFFRDGDLYLGRGTNAANKIILRNLPTSDPGVDGQLWRVTSNLYISTGP